MFPLHGEIRWLFELERIQHSSLGWFFMAEGEEVQVWGRLRGRNGIGRKGREEREEKEVGREVRFEKSEGEWEEVEDWGKGE